MELQRNPSETLKPAVHLSRIDSEPGNFIRTLDTLSNNSPLTKSFLQPSLLDRRIFYNPLVRKTSSPISASLHTTRLHRISIHITIFASGGDGSQLDAPRIDRITACANQFTAPAFTPAETTPEPSSSRWRVVAVVAYK